MRIYAAFFSCKYIRFLIKMLLSFKGLPMDSRNVKPLERMLDAASKIRCKVVLCELGIPRLLPWGAFNKKLIYHQTLIFLRQKSGHAQELPPSVPTDPYVKLSLHTALLSSPAKDSSHF